MDLELVKMKVCMVGEAAVGKTSLVRRFVLDIFNEAYAATLGARVTKRELHFQGLELDKHVRVDMTLWDIMGERFVRDELRESYLLGAQAVIAVADVARPSTLDALEVWVDWVRNAVGEVPVVYAVNKIDLLAELMRRPNDEEIERLFGMKDVSWFFTSSRSKRPPRVGLRWDGPDLRMLPRLSIVSGGFGGRDHGPYSSPRSRSRLMARPNALIRSTRSSWMRRSASAASRRATRKSPDPSRAASPSR